MDGLWQDVRIGMRTLRKSPGFAVVVVMTLALGIGANASIFSLVNFALLRPRPGITDPDRLVELGHTREGRGFDPISRPRATRPSATRQAAPSARTWSGPA